MTANDTTTTVACHRCTAPIAERQEGYRLTQQTQTGAVDLWFCSRLCRSRHQVDAAGWRNRSVEEQVLEDDGE